VFENRVLRKIFESKSGRGWGSKGRLDRKLQNEELHDLYSTRNIIWVIKSKGIR